MKWRSAIEGLTLGAARSISVNLGVLVAALLASGGAIAQNAPLDEPGQWTPLEVHVGGRARAASASGDAWDYAWPGVYFEGRFNGSAVDVLLSDTQSTLSIQLDGAEIARLSRPGAITYPIRDLPAGEHTVRVVKTTESYAGFATFKGFRIPQDQTALPAPARPVQMEFVGDSEMLGLSNLSTRRDCEPNERVDLTDTDISYGALTAKHFGADYRVVAMSSHGLLRNYGGGDKGQNMQALYDRVLPYDPATPFDPAASPVPDIIVIGLGTNDFAAGLQPGEEWPDMAALHLAYREAYAGFIARLRKDYPEALIVLTAISFREYAPDVRVVTQQLQGAGDTRVLYLPFEGLSLGGCNYHPDANDHRIQARALIDLLSQHMTLWKSASVTPFN